MNIVFRVDASHVIGSGHVMRCLTLAEKLREHGATCWFICRQHAGNLAEKIKHYGFSVSLLPRQSNLNDNEPLYSQWLGASMEVDAQQTQQHCAQLTIDWLIIDHYGIGEDWQKHLRPNVKKIFVIDDLANRAHICDLLLDQTYARSIKSYADFIPKNCHALCGSSYALLRPEFAEARTQSLNKPPSHRLRLLVFMGGSDPENLSTKVLSQLERTFSKTEVHCTLILGSQFRHHDKVRKITTQSSLDIDVLENIDNMAELMSQADLAIGAAGSSAWERACLGLPSIQLKIAENQQEIALQLSRNNAVICIDNLKQLPNVLAKAIKQTKKMSLLSASLVDGKGCQRVLDAMLNLTPKNQQNLRPIVLEDSAFLYQLQCEKNVRKYFKNTEVPSPEVHKKWFKTFFMAEDKVCFIVENNNEACGMLRLDLLPDCAEVSIIISNKACGLGLGKFSLNKLIELCGHTSLIASVHKNNIASLGLFKACGFSQLNTEAGEFLEFKR
jgi:UDP-2,4-diacetamido-2,4,6-trideoxy-beta-L-altropyranose hydrolase